GRLAGGQLRVSDANDSLVMGSLTSDTDLKVEIDVFDQDFYWRTLFGGTIGSAEAYMDGQWRVDDLTNLIRVLIRNINSITSLDRTWNSLRKLGHWAWHQFRRNTLEGSRKNIHEHYDLGNDFYQLFLDSTMNYSSGIFPQNESTMLQSSLFKMNWISEKLQLKESDHVLEIGTGWGGLACFMAKHYRCHVTTTTISKAQYDYAVEQVKREGLEDYVNVRLDDYRNLNGKYDKLVSIEMIEAVGHQYFDQYFGKCNDLLQENGLMLLQGITMSQQNYQQHLKNVDFIRRYIFPGGCLPSIVGIGESLGKVSNMRIVHLEDITEHYVKTLQQWRHRFFDNIERVRELGYDDRFIRMWHFYLCYCEAAFAERRVNTVQMVMAKPGSEVDPANQYSRIGATSFDFDSLYELESSSLRHASTQRNSMNPRLSRPF
ncbi:MAG: cyclopropane-fatty-acyl-phospholipid synthase family protein, partial [Planctomycetota bacterium]